MKRVRGKAEKHAVGESALRPIRVRSVKDAERLLARVLRHLQQDEISESKAKTIAYVANSYAKMFEMSEIERRIEELEAAIQARNQEATT